MVTHDMHLMLEYTERAIVIADGKLVCDELPSRVLTDGDVIRKANLKEIFFIRGFLHDIP